jgi:hypothetical protein
MAAEETHSKTATTHLDPFTPDEGGLSPPVVPKIPITDPQEALEFCQNLAAFLAEQSSSGRAIFDPTEPAF